MNLRRLVEKQEAAGEAAKLSQQYISDLTTGRRVNPKLQTLQRIAAALKVEVSDLLRDPDAKKEAPCPRYAPANISLHDDVELIVTAHPAPQTFERIVGDFVGDIQSKKDAELNG